MKILMPRTKLVLSRADYRAFQGDEWNGHKNVIIKLRLYPTRKTSYQHSTSSNRLAVVTRYTYHHISIGRGKSNTMKNCFDWLFHYIHRHSTISINTTQLKDIDLEFQFHYCNIVTRNVGFKNGFDPRMRNEFLLV